MPDPRYRVRCDLEIEAVDEREARAIAAAALNSSALFQPGVPDDVVFCAGTVTVERIEEPNV